MRRPLSIDGWVNLLEWHQLIQGGLTLLAPATWLDAYCLGCGGDNVAQPRPLGVAGGSFGGGDGLWFVH